MANVNVRAVAARVLSQVMDKGLSLSEALPAGQKQVADKDAALLQEICFGVTRHFSFYDGITQQLLSKKLKGKQRVFHHLINVGLYQIDQMRTPEHAAVAETVQAAVALKGPGLKGLVNGCLRNYLRNKEQLENKVQSARENQSHPGWIVKRLKSAYTDNWQHILENNQQRAPMWLRVHNNNCSLDKFVAALGDNNISFSQPLSNPHSILLDKPLPVDKIPGFENGWFTVQDGAAQHAATLLQPEHGDVVLDACTAPGGKACHILDLADCDLTAVDIDENRLERVGENLSRLKLKANVQQLDLSDIDAINNLPEFDRILLDAPCSATGVIRRHPDIKWLRRDEDIVALADLQQQILHNLWPKLKVGGTLVYATCSIMPEENKHQMQAFLSNNSNAKLDKIIDSESETNPGWQILPGDHAMDGFYYCRIKKI